MALDWKDVAMLSDRAKTPEMLSFLEVVRKENPHGPIAIVLDNARIHTAAMTKIKARDLDIYLVYLPPYSPDLQPIEFGWKDIKRELSAILNFDQAICEARGIALKLFSERRQSYTKHWSETFIGLKS